MINDDDSYEPNQYFTVIVSGTYEDGGDTVNLNDEVIVRIRENDERYLTLSPVSNSALPMVSHPEFMAKEGGTGNENQLTISLNEPLPYDLDIKYTVGDDPYTTASAVSDKDFTMDSGTATIDEGKKYVTIDIVIADDQLVEPTEYFTLDFGIAGKANDPGNAKGTFKTVNFQDSKLSSQPLSVSIMDNDTAEMQGVVHLRGEGGGGIEGFPSTRKTLTEGESVTITAEIAGTAPQSNIQIPLKFAHYPSGEATESDYNIPISITIPAGQRSAGVTLAITDDTDDERYRELLVVEIDNAMNFPAGYTKGDRSKYEVVMLDNDKTPASLLMPSATALTEAAGARTATFQLRIDRRPKANPTETPPFTGADTKEVDAKLVLGYTGKATRGTDYKLNPNNDIVIRKSPAEPPSSCSLDGEVVTCTVTLTVQDDNLYEGNKPEDVKIDLDTGKSSFSGGIKKPTGLNLTIEDDDPQPMFSIADVSGPENGNLTFTVTRTGAQGNDVSVTAGTGNHADATNGATADTDYTTRRGSELRFKGGAASQDFVVAVTDDNIDEPNETFAVTLSKPVDNQQLPKPGIKPDGKTAVGTIQDNDTAPTKLTISVDTETIAEAADPTTVSVTATITSDTRFATDQTVTITVGNPENEGEASEGAGGDYETVEVFNITIPATEASGKGTFELTPLNDRIDDDGEKISVEGELDGMTVNRAAITIVDDDARGITVTPTTLTIDEADDPSTSPAEEHKGTYEVALTSQPEGGTVTVDITNPGPTVATADPSSLTFDADNWEMAQTVTMIAKDDTIDDIGDQKTTTITHSVSADGTDYAGEDVEDVEVTVRDDDEAPMALTLTVDTDTGTDSDQDTISEGADEPTVRITATLDGDTQFATDQTITITVGADGDTATEGSGGDYNTVAEFDITLPAGAESVFHDQSLTLNDDDVDEADKETITVTGELADVTVKGTSFTIEDNDATPTVTLVLTPASINESGATNASTVTATMDGKSSDAVTLTVSATPDSPAVAGDFTLSENKTLTIPANTQESTGVVTITAVDNEVDAANKTVTVAATATGGNTLVKAPDDQTLTITDDDTRGITVSKPTLTLDEEDNTATMDADEHRDTYTVVLDSEPSGGTVTIGVASGDTTIAGVAPATLTFTASDWSEPQTVTVTAVPDGIDNEMDRRTAAITHTVTATGTDYEDASASAVTVTVNDDDGPSTLSINSPSVTEVDGTATATLTFTVQLLPQSDKQVTVAYADAGTGTATSGGTDYVTLASGTLTFAPGVTSQSVAVTVNGDDIDEPEETVVVRLSSPSNATLTGGATTLDGTGTINDNDATPTVSVADATAVSEGDVASPNPANNMTFAVTLSAASGRTVTVPYTLSGTATAGTDYTEPDPRSVMIAAGQTQASIVIPVAGDEVDEENETITVTLGTPTNATVSTAEGAGAASGTITDDDARGVSVTPTTLTVAEADNAGTAATREDQETYKVVLTSQPTGAVTVNLKSGDESVARIDTASLVFDADDWNMAQTVTVTGQADVIDNTGDERTTTIAHTVSAAGTDYADETAEGVTVTVTDDDAAPNGITLTANPDSVTENGGAKTITVTAAVNGATRYAEARTVSVSVGGGTAMSGTDYTAVDSFDITIGAGEDDATKTFTLTPENDVLAEGDETINVMGTLSGVTITPGEITLTDNDAAPSGITLSVDTNGAEDGTPSTVEEDAGATVVTVTATVNGTTRYVDAKTVMVSVADGTAASPGDYAAVNNFNITIAAGAASHTGSFTVTPVDDDLDEANETINVTGKLSSVTITGATVTFTDNDDPVSFSIADAEAMEGGKVTFTVSRAGAGDNVATVKVTTATDSGDGVNAADADDYTAIATAQTLNFAKGVASQTVEVQTTQDDLFEPDETFKAVLSAPALADGDPGTGASIEAGKGRATGTIRNDDTEPSFAVADASATEGDDITFTVTRSGAMDNAVSVKWNTKPDTGADAASATDYTPVTAATTLSFAKDVGTQTFTVATTEDVLAEGNETFLVELTGAEGGTISTAEATGTITDDDDAPSGITLSVDTNGATSGTPTNIGEEAGATTVRVTATIVGTTRFATAQTVAVTVGKDGDSATEGTDYAMVGEQSIEIPIGAASAYVDFPLTPTSDVLSEGSETISVEGTLTDVTFTNTAITITDDDAAPGAITLSVDADTGTNNVQSSIAEEGGVKTVRVTATIDGTTRFATAQTVTVTVGKDGDTATEGTDYAMVDQQSIEIPIGAASGYVEFMLTPTTDVLFEGSETISLDGTLTGVTFTNSSITINDDDAAPSAITLSVDTNAGGDGTPTTLAEGAAATTVRVTATITSATRFAANQAVTFEVGKSADSATEGTDYTEVGTLTITIDGGETSGYVDFTLTPTSDVLDEPNETISVHGTQADITFTDATITINDDDAAPSAITLAVDTNAGGNGTPTSVGEEAGATTVRVTATITSATRFAANQAVTFEVGKSADSATEDTDYTEIGTLTITIDGGEQTGYVDFTLTPTSDVLDEPNETISVEGTQANITFTDATITINDDDATPSGITLSVDTNGSTSGTPSTVAEDAGATVVTVTATVNGTTRYVDAKTVVVSVDDDTAASPGDYAAVSGFNITIAAGAASHTGSFTVTPVDDDLDESDETIDVTGTLTDITVTGATVTLTDTDDPVSFSIADAEATEGGKVTFTVSRKGAEDNVASVKVATATDSGDGVNAADADDYTAIATAQTLNFAKDVTSQTVEVQTTQDDLFEPDETFKAVLSAPALGDGDPGTGVSIETGKGTATGTIKNDDTRPSFAVADASASEGDAITFTVTRSGAMDNAVSVKWNTKADSSDGANAASASDYTPVTAARTLTFARGVSSQTFTVATTEDVLDEENETFLVELTGAVGATIATAQATGTINDDDAAPTGITLTVSPATVGEEDGETRITVTATVNGETRYVDAKTVTVSVGGGSATSATDYDAVANFDITIAAGDASKAGTFDLTPTDDDLHEGSETIDVTGTSDGLTITKASITLEDDDAQPSFAVADASASEGDAITFTVTRSGAMDNAVSVKWNTRAATGAGAASTTDYAAMTTATKLDFAKGVRTQTFTVSTTEDTLNEVNETFLIELTDPVGGTITTAEATGTITNDDAAPTTLTLAVDADNNTENVQTSLAEDGGAKTVKVTATLGGSTQFDVDKTLTLIVGKNTDSATEGTDYTNVADVTLTIPAGDQDVEHTFTLTPTDDAFNEASETISFDATITGVTVAGASITLTSEDAAPAITLTVDADKDTDNVQTSLAEDGGVKTVRVTATLDGTTRLEEAADLTLAVGKNSDSATEGTDYATVADRTITIGAGIASVTDDFTLTPTNDNLYEGSETISLDGTLMGVTVTNTSLTLTDDDAQPSFAVADASASEGDAITFTVTRSGAMDNVVSVKWNTKAATGAGAAATSDYTEMTTATKLDFAKGVSSQTFTVATTEDTLHEGNETFLIELTEPVGAIISDAQATGTITDDDTAPSGITLSVDTNGSTSGTPSTVAEDAGATVVTVTATVNGTTRYVEARTVAVSVADDTATSPGDYAAVSNFNITIAAGAASHTGSFTVTPVDDDLDESDETIDVTGTLTDITITPATVTLTDTDAPVSFSIADAEATEGGKVTFTVSRAGAEDNVAEVKIATAADSGDDVNAAGTDDYTAIAAAQTLSFAKGVTSQTVEVQTTQDDLFEPDETFKAVLSAPALGDGDPGTGVSIETGKGTAIGTIKNDDTQPSFAVADASADEGDAITFTVTRSGAMDNAVSVKWNTKADSSDGASAASTSDYTAVTTAQTLTFAKGVSSQNFTVATTEDTLHEGNETFLVELTEAVGATISDAEATGTINDDDVAPAALTLTVDADTSTENVQTSLAEDGGAKTVRVTATLGGSSTFTEAKTVTVEVGADADSAEEGTDYTTVAQQSITINAGKSSGYVEFTITPTDDDIDEPSEGISIEGTLTGITVAGTAITLTDDEVTPTVTLVLTPTAIDESGNGNASTVTAMLSGKSSVAVTLTVAAAAGADTVGGDFTVTTNKTLTIAAGATTSTGAVTITAVDNDVDAPNKSVTVSATASGGGVADPTDQTLTINDDEGVPTATLVLMPTAIDESGGTNASTVTATLSGKSNAAVTLTVAAAAGANTASGDFTLSTTTTLTIAAGATTSTGAVTITAVDNDIDAPNKSVTVSATASGGGVANPADQTLTINDDDAAPSGITLSVSPATLGEGDGLTQITVTATVNGTTRYADAKTVTVSVGGGTATSATDYDAVANFDITIAAGDASKTGTFDLTPTNDVLDEANETINVTGTSGSLTITPTMVTITDDDDAPGAITISVDADTGTDGTQTTIAENGGAKTVRVTATITDETRFVEAKTVSVEVGADADSATEGADYANLGTQSIRIDAGAASGYVEFTLTPMQDTLHEGSETISLDGTLAGVTVTDATITLTDDDGAPTALTLSVDADTGTMGTQTSLAEDGGAKTVRVTATLGGSSTFTEAKTVTVEVGADADSAEEGNDYTTVAQQSITINAGSSSGYVEFTLTPTQDVLHEGSETISLDGTLAGVTVTDATITLTDDDAAPSGITLTVSPATVGEGAGETEITVTATVNGSTRYVDAKTVTVSVGGGTATSDTDYDAVANFDIIIAAGDASKAGTFDLTPTDDDLHEGSETIDVTGTSGALTITKAEISLTDDDGQPSFAVADASASEGETITFTVTRSGAMDNTVSVKWNTKAATGAGAAATTDYTAMTTATKLDFAMGVSSQTFTVATTEDTLHEGNETFLIELTDPVGAIISDAQATGTINDDDAAPSGITLSVDTNGSTSGTPSTVAEDAGATVVTVTATVNGTTRYVDAKTVVVSVADNTAASPADYAAVNNFNITIAAGAASHTGSFTVTPVDDDLDEADETIDVTGTLSSVTITGTTVTLTDTDDPVSFSIADAEATEGGKVTFTVSRAGAEDNVASVKIATAADSGDDVNAAGTDDYTAIATAQTLNFAKGVTSQTVDVQTTQDDLFEPDETFKAVLSGEALADGDPGTGVSIETGKGTAIGTIKNDDTQPSFAVANASAAEGDAITFTVTRSGAMDNAVSVKWNTKADSGANAASTSDYTAMTTATTLTFAKDVGTQTFTVATTEDVLHEENETFLVELTGAVGGTIATSQATGTINDDDAAPTGITLTVSPATVGEGAGETEITVTATVNGSTRYVDAKTVTVSVGGGTATSDTDYDAVANFDIVIAAGDASKAGTFDLTPTDDDLHEGSETIGLDGTVTGVTVTDASLTLTDDDGQPSFAVADASADEGETITFTVTRSGAMDNAVSVKWNTKAATGAGAAATTDYTEMTTATKLDFASGVSSQTFTVATTEDTLHEGNETFLIELTDPVGAIVSDAEATGTITDDDAAPTALTLTVDADTGTNNVQTSLAEDGGAKMVRVTATLGGSSTFNVAKTVAVEIGADADGAVEGTDYTNLGTQNITINAGASSGYVDFTLTPTDDDIDEPNEGISIEGTLTDVMVTGTTITLTDDEGTPTVTLVLTPTTINESGGTNSSTVTATLSGESSAAVTVEVSVPNAAPVTLSSNTTLTIAPGSKASTGAVTITAVDNDVDAPNKTVTVSAVASGGGVANPGNQTLTINDDEGIPTATLVLDPTAIDESGATNSSTVTATLSGKSNEAVTLTVAAAAGADTAAGDFTLSATTTLTIAAGATTSTGAVTITAVDNDIDAPNKSVTVSATASGGGVADPTNQTLTITDDEGVPTVTLALDPTTINESGNGNASTVTATLSGKSSAAVTVTVSVPNGAPVTLSNNAILSIAAGATTSTGTVTITAVDNDVDAANASVVVSGAASGGGVTNPDNQTLTITDDEGTPTVTLVLTPTAINESGNGNASTVTATLSGESSAAVTVEVSVPNDAPVTLSANKTLTIAAGSKASTGVVTITAVDNDVDAPNKTVTVSATASGGGVSDPTDQTLTITDDEGTPTVTLALDPTTINESGNGNASTVTATLSGESSAAVTVEVSVPNNAPVTLSGNTTLTIAAGSKASTGTVTITAVDNDVDAPNASVVVSGVAAGGGVAVANPGNQTLTITDDEGTPTVTLVLTPTAINESGNGNASTVTATLSGKSNTAVTLTVVAAAGANTAAGDFTLSATTTLTIAAGATASTGTVKITAVNNNVDAPDKSVTVSATASGGGVTNPDNQTLTITDDDAAPTGITLSVSPATLDEGDGLTQITVTAAVNGTTRYVDARTVTVSVGGGTAISGTDYGAVSNFDITIAAGDASETGTFDLTPTDDTLHEEDETIEVTGTSGALTITPAAVTITDNDAAGPVGTVSLSTSRYEVLEGDSLSVTVNLSEAPAADTMIELEATSPGGYSATPGADYVGGVQTVTIRAGTTSGKAHIPTTRDNQNDPNETFKLAIRASELPGTVTLGEPDTAVVTIREPVSGITPPETATVVYAGRNSRILMPVPAGLKGHGIDVAFYFDWGPGTAQGGGDCREPGTDVVDWGHWPSYPEGMVRTGPLVRIAEDINTDTIELEIELCKGSEGKTFTASWDSLQWLGNPDRGFPGVKSYPFNAAAAHCTSTALCYTRVTIIGDTPDPDPEITIAAGGDITEGGDAVFTVQASPAPASDLEIALAIADDAVSDFLMDGEEGSKTVTIAAGSDTATYTLATTDDDLDEANGGVSATLEAGTGYRVDSPSTATVAVADNDGDDDARATVVRITGGADITEGGVARFTLTGTPVPSQDITVNLRVTQSGAFAGDGELGARPVTLGTDATVTVDIPTVDDSTLEDDGSLTITVEPGTGYTPHATDASATVAVADDEVPSLPTIHIDDVEAAEGDDLHFTFTLSHAVDHEVVVYWETRFGANYHNASNNHGPSYGEAVPHADFRYADSRVTVYPGSTRGEFWVETFDDFHDEGRETLTVVLTEAEGAIIADELAIGTIVNSDPMPAAWLARFGRAVAEQALDGIAGRIAAPRTAGMQGMIAGQALSFGGSTGVGAASPHGSLSGTSLSDRARLSLSDIDRLFGDERAIDRSRTLSGRDLLLGSRFTLTGERDATGGNLAFWGRAAQSGFDGREGRFSLDGEAMTAMLGADYARDQWLAGMALMRSSGKGGGSYADPGSESGADSGSGRGAGGKVEATLTAAIPYLALQASERVKLWGALGHGVGEVMLKPELGEMLKSDISWSMASLGLRGDLLPTRESPGSESGSGAGGPALALVSDALWAGTSSEKTRGLAASDSDVTRLRLGLEGSWKAPLEGDASITPKLEMGMRHDGGDAETGFGVELGGGIAWMDPRLGLSLDLSGRALVAHDAGDLENRGFSTSLAFDPDPASERGLSFALRQDWGGQAEGGLDALFQADPLSERTGSGSTSGSRWSAEGAYGFPALSGRFISSPHMGIGLATGARDYSLGWRLTPARNAPDISFRLKATRRESDGAAPEHTVGFEISARW